MCDDQTSPNAEVQGGLELLALRLGSLTPDTIAQIKTDYARLFVGSDALKAAPLVFCVPHRRANTLR